MIKYRDYKTEYYDAFTTQTNDTDFYCKEIADDTNVLEIGCGTGRVTFHLAKKVKTIIAIDLSDTMLEKARETQADGYENIEFIKADMTALDLNKKFDFIIAPFRVIQCLEKNEQIAGLFTSIKNHLAPNGTCILNAFNPKQTKENMARNWPQENETYCGETTLPDGDLVKMTDIRKRLDAYAQVLYPELVYRRYRDGELVETFINPICMRYFYQDEFKSCIESHDFKIVKTWGGYNGEEYGKGNELVVAFMHKVML